MGGGARRTAAGTWATAIAITIAAAALAFRPAAAADPDGGAGVADGGPKAADAAGAAGAAPAGDRPAARADWGGGGVGTKGPASLSAAQPGGPGVGRIPAELALRRAGPGRERSYVWPAGEAAAMTLAMLGWDKWVGHARWADVNADTIGDNLRGPWVLDADHFWINEFAHPYQGTWSYVAARSAGLSFWQSVPYVVAASTVWEIAGESDPPSINDEVNTPIGGAVFGEVLWRAIGMIRRERGSLRSLASGMLSPFAAANRHALGDWTEPPENPAELSAWVGAVGMAEDPRSDAATRGLARPELGVRLVYGPAGDPDTRLERPFDHFELVASYGAYLDPVASLLARGVVAGGQFEGTAGRGLWGVYLGYDLVTPGTYRVATTYVGIGTSTRFFLAPVLALDVDAVASGVAMGAAGHAYAGPDGKGRDYHFGPGFQGALDGRLRVGTRAEVALSGRFYFVQGAQDSVGDERIGMWGASALVRVLGPHALGAEATLLTRASTGLAADPAVHEDGRVVRVFYAYAPASPIAPVRGAEDVARR